MRRGDFTDPGTLAPAFEGASQVLVVSVDKIGDEGAAQSIAAIDAAYRSLRKRLLHGEFAVTDPALGVLLGREPQPIRSALEVSVTE